ncbi:MAG: ATP-dependent RecD-like DNA helicase [Ignavibacteriae bacterium HGW-Ignavibacteriae-3]|nr:MAG: ATP-dependent RecD-like DNA helicase [Ignavibacteriae bacterium HGW-Ignavibacteriae-3]
MQTIEAILEGYLYKNEVNGYCIASFSNGLKAVGILPNVKIGEKLKLTGEFETHSKYGEQFKIESYSIVYPSTTAGISKYLGSGLIKGVGPSTAEKIVNVFKENTFEILDTDINRLLDVEGIGLKKLDLIKKSWDEQKAIKEIMIFLQSFDISPSYALKIYRTYGADSVRIVQENPYQLTYDVWGIGFKIADAIGKNAGFSHDHPKRIKAGIIYVLNEASGEGHVYLPMQEILKKCYDVLGIDLTDSYLIFREMEVQNLVNIIDENIYLANYYEAERNIEKKIKILSDGTSGISEKEIKSIRFNSLYSDEQLEAIRNSLTNKILILTGGPGTGKTTALKGIIETYRTLKKNIMLAAPTGRAAKRMSEVIGMEAKTIHRLLEYNPMDRLFMRDEENPLETDLLVVDEISMIDTLLMNSLMSAVSPHTTLVLVGDVDQLPSLGSGNVLHDLIQSGIIPTAMLTKIFRQAEESQIVVNAHKINRGEFPVLINNESSDFFFIHESDNSNIADVITELCRLRLPEKYGFDPMKDIQILTPMYKGDTGAINLNSRLQDVLNRKKIILARGEKNFKIGDKVMQLRNNYDKDVYNGDIGLIQAIDMDDQKLEINYSGKIVSYEFLELDDITLAYAITVHKSQGSEYPCVIMPITTAHYIMLQRNLIYTAVTRASKMMILVGSKQALAMAVGNKKSRKRYTSLFRMN